MCEGIKKKRKVEGGMADPGALAFELFVHAWCTHIMWLLEKEEGQH